MARTEQTARGGGRGGKLTLATFSRGGGPAPSTSNNGDDGGKCPRGRAPWHSKTGPCQGKMPPDLRIAQENTTCRMMGSNATPQGYYKVSEKHKQFKWKPGMRSLWEIWFYQKSTTLLLRQLPFLQLI